MSLIDMIVRKLSEPGAEPLTVEERAQFTEAIRRRDAWMVFVEYHEHAMWAREDAERKIEENAYLPPEAVDYMKGEIKRRAGRKALLAALEANDGKEKDIRNSGGQDARAGAGSAQGGQTAQRSDKPDGSGHAADDPRAAGEGKGGAGGTAEAPERALQTQAVEPDFATGTTACDFKLAGELQAPGRGHESQSAAYQAAAETYGAIDGTAYGVRGKSEGPKT